MKRTKRFRAGPWVYVFILLLIGNFIHSIIVFGREQTSRAPNLSNPAIYPITDSKQLAGEPFWLEIQVGRNDDQIDDLFGISFILIYNSQWLELMQPPEAAIQGGDLLGDPTEIQILPLQILGDTLATAITRTDTTSSANGFGLLMQIGFQSKKSTPNFTEVCFSIADIAATDSAWNPITLSPESFCLVIERPYGIRPNPFTPNGDGYNDQVEFLLPELNEAGGIIRIFNLWGRKVRQLEQDWFWNGTDESGNDLPPGTYLYVIESQGDLITKGTLGLVR